ncbi:hypothetical protein [Rhodococcus pyridinivorans]|uniref:hypothetical protein n=1 Tax=Rhodococcus pyridinivorans TaxID=103816 RepID=UPI0020C7CC91|nr:hypothetical protein [Rhodococcus pyridinivorans]
MTAVRTRSRSRLLRDTASSAQVEALLIITVATILVTRLYLHLTGYPQVGGSVLHIAHVLWGGLLMVAALMVSLTFIGRAPDRIAVLLGGIGFGLFLDEVGKFVTKTNDYFYRPSVAIMYVVVVLLLVVNRAVHLRRGPSPDEYLANAALTATDGLAHGLTPTDRDQARVQLERAREGGVDPEVVEQIDLLLAQCREVPSRFSWVSLRLPERLRGERSVRVAAALLTVLRRHSPQCRCDLGGGSRRADEQRGDRDPARRLRRHRPAVRGGIGGFVAQAEVGDPCAPDGRVDHRLLRRRAGVRRPGVRGAAQRRRGRRGAVGVLTPPASDVPARGAAGHGVSRWAPPQPCCGRITAPLPTVCASSHTV